MKKMVLRKSEVLFNRSRKSLTGGVSSAMRSAMKPFPLFFERGTGSKIYDVDGNSYIDYTLSFGPLILGHRPQSVLDAVQKQLKKGWIFGAQHKGEIYISEKLQKIIPCAEMVRYASTGSEAIHIALRLARAYTKRQKIIKFEGHYHGWFDNIFIGYHPKNSNLGPETEGQVDSVKKDIIVLPWNDLDIFEKTLKKIHNDVAAVITEPMMCNSGVNLPLPGYLEGLRRLTRRYGIILIFDEVITGFRIALGGAQEYFRVTPDLAVYGKAMASGFPISCLAGNAKIMKLIGEQKVVHAGTFNSNPISVSAAIATIEELESNNRMAYRRLSKLGDRMRSGIKNIGDSIKFPLLVQGIGPVFHLFFTNKKNVNNYREYLESDMKSYESFVGNLLYKGILALSRGVWYISTSHSEGDIDKTLKVIKEVLEQYVKMENCCVRDRHGGRWG